MNTIILDTLDFSTKLKAGGFTEQQAETLARAIAEIFEKLMSHGKCVCQQTEFKRNIHESENRLEFSIKGLEARMKEMEITLKKDIEILRAETNKDISDTKADLIRWVVGVGVLQLSIITALLLKLSNQL